MLVNLRTKMAILRISFHFSLPAAGPCDIREVARSSFKTARRGGQSPAILKPAFDGNRAVRRPASSGRCGVPRFTAAEIRQVLSHARPNCHRPGPPLASGSRSAQFARHLALRRGASGNPAVGFLFLPRCVRRWNASAPAPLDRASARGSDADCQGAGIVEYIQSGGVPAVNAVADLTTTPIPSVYTDGRVARSCRNRAPLRRRVSQHCLRRPHEVVPSPQGLSG